jgi:hypothetical protein
MITNKQQFESSFLVEGFNVAPQQHHCSLGAFEIPMLYRAESLEMDAALLFRRDHKEVQPNCSV